MSISDSTQFGAFDAKTNFSQLLARVESGEEITITKHGSPVARLVPVNEVCSPQRRRAAITRWKELAKGLSLGDLRLRDLIDEGRP